MTAVRIQGNPKKGESVDNMKKTHPDAIVVIDSMALFKGDKLVGFCLWRIQETIYGHRIRLKIHPYLYHVGRIGLLR